MATSSSTPVKADLAPTPRGKKDVKLVIQDDRNVVLYAADGAAWSSRAPRRTAAPRRPASAGRAPVRVGASGSTKRKKKERKEEERRKKKPQWSRGHASFLIAKQYLSGSSPLPGAGPSNNVKSDHVEVSQVIEIPDGIHS